jgi:endonuclease/exonuclease/phosphatase family metal-dependent hydrolase
MCKNRRITLAIVSVGLGLLAVGASAVFLPVFSQGKEGMSLCVMTFNLRYASAKPPNSWPERRPVMGRLIKKTAPDLIGTQEGLYPQLKDLAADLPEYEWIGLGRDGGSRGEFMAVWYRRDRFEPMAYDHFWLSDTPEVVGSSTWGNSNRRMVTWVRFRERRTGREFYFWNTHLDQQIELARQKAASLIVERAGKIRDGLPLLLVGDFNATAGSSRAYEILTKDGGFSDVWALAGRRINETLNSFHNYNKPLEEKTRIDWLLVRGPVEVEKAEIITYAENGQAPSDHFPVAAWLVLPLSK